MDPKPTQKPEGKITFKEFLEKTPPGRWLPVSQLWLRVISSGPPRLYYQNLFLHCSEETCAGHRFFKSISSSLSVCLDRLNDSFLIYTCCNCGKSKKTFAVCTSPQNQGEGKAFKYGEFPPFGPPTPTRVIKLIGPDQEMFLTGRRAENQGMGIGAFTYYRRVVENQKNRIFDEIIRVTKKISPDDPVIVALEKAKNQTQFTTAVESIKAVLPAALLINGHNPLTLLHSALSKGVHDHSEEECLELASDVRTILFEFAEKLGQALKDNAEITQAVGRLTRGRTKG